MGRKRFDKRKFVSTRSKFSAKSGYVRIVLVVDPILWCLYLLGVWGAVAGGGSNKPDIVIEEHVPGTAIDEAEKSVGM